MNTRQLIQFAAVAYAGNISEAAKRLHMAQPALSHAIAVLETDLGVKLLVRHRRGVELTDAGAVLLERTQSILDQINAAREVVREVDANPSGHVSIALPASVAHALAGPIGEAIIGRYPRIHLEIEEGLTGNLMRWLRGGGIDLMIDFDVDETGELVREALIEEELYLIGADLGGEGEIEFAHLRRFPMFLPAAEHGMGRAIARYERKADLELARLPMRVSVHPMLALIRAGLGYSVSAWSLIHDQIDDSTLQARRIVNPEMTRTAYLVHPRTRSMSNAGRIVRDVIRSAVAQVHAAGRWRGRLLLNDTAVAAPAR